MSREFGGGVSGKRGRGREGGVDRYSIPSRCDCYNNMIMVGGGEGSWGGRG